MSSAVSPFGSPACHPEVLKRRAPQGAGVRISVGTGPQNPLMACHRSTQPDVQDGPLIASITAAPGAVMWRTKARVGVTDRLLSGELWAPSQARSPLCTEKDPRGLWVPAAGRLPSPASPGPQLDTQQQEAPSEGAGLWCPVPLKRQSGAELSLKRRSSRWGGGALVPGPAKPRRARAAGKRARGGLVIAGVCAHCRGRPLVPGRDGEKPQHSPRVRASGASTPSPGSHRQAPGPALAAGVK